MADTPTTEDVVADEGAEALPNEQEQQVAEETVQSEEKEGAEALPNESDDKLANFAKAQGIEDVNELSDRERQLLKVAHDNHVGFRQKQNKDSELQKSVEEQAEQQAEVEAQATGYDVELLKTVRGLEVKNTVRDFFDANPGAKELEQDMVEVIAQRPHLANDLDAVYALASKDATATKAKRETLENLAQKQQAATPRGSATSKTATTEKITSENVNQLVAQNSHDWFVKNYDAINAALKQ